MTMSGQKKFKLRIAQQKAALRRQRIAINRTMTERSAMAAFTKKFFR